MVALAAAGLCGCKKAAPVQAPPPAVVFMTLAPTNVPLHGEFIGQLDSPQNVEIRARVEAFVEAIPFVEGLEVKAVIGFMFAVYRVRTQRVAMGGVCLRWRMAVDDTFGAERVWWEDEKNEQG